MNDAEMTRIKDCVTGLAIEHKNDRGGNRSATIRAAQITWQFPGDNPELNHARIMQFLRDLGRERLIPEWLAELTALAPLLDVLGIEGEE